MEGAGGRLRTRCMRRRGRERRPSGGAAGRGVPTRGPPRAGCTGRQSRWLRSGPGVAGRYPAARPCLLDASFAQVVDVTVAHSRRAGSAALPVPSLPSDTQRHQLRVQCRQHSQLVAEHEDSAASALGVCSSGRAGEQAISHRDQIVQARRQANGMGLRRLDMHAGWDSARGGEAAAARLAQR